jgi:hypothetical protein
MVVSIFIYTSPFILELDISKVSLSAIFLSISAGATQNAGAPHKNTRNTGVAAAKGELHHTTQSFAFTGRINSLLVAPPPISFHLEGLTKLLLISIHQINNGH